MTLQTDKGFSLVELLIVIVIIGIMAAMIGPTFTTGSDSARVKTASRGVMQMSRYARTMALLHQTPVDLVFTSDGSLSVTQAGGGGESLVTAGAFAVTNAAVAAEETEVAKAAADKSDEPAKTTQNSGGASYVMADLAIVKKYDRVVFRFVEYSDTIDDGRGARHLPTVREEENETSAEGEMQTFRISYKSNGTCRPYQINVTAEGDEEYVVTIAVDVRGSAKIKDD